MKRIAHFLVEKRLILFLISVSLALIFSLFIGQVNINKDMKEYLADDSNMSKGLEIMENEFPVTVVNDSFYIMFEGLTKSEKLEIYNNLATFEGVESVTYDIDSTDYNSKGYTMYIVTTKYSMDSEKVNAVIKEMTNTYDEYTVETYYSGGYIDVLDLLIPMAVTIMLIVLFMMCRSYIEPALILVSLGVAILINMGSNIIFPMVSEMTFSIAAVFQLVLSIDYSIMLIHRYVQEYELLEEKNPVVAMENAIANGLSSIASSSITTIVGLMALLLMTFTIGTDIGLVLAKGVLMSLICVFTVMPSLIIWSSNLLFNTSKENIRLRRIAGGAENV